MSKSINELLASVIFFIKQPTGLVPNDLEAQFEEERKNLVYIRAKIVLVVGIASWLFFAPIDYILYTEIFPSLVMIRILVCLVFGFLLLIGKINYFKKRSEIFGSTVIHTTCLLCILHVCVTGGEDSVYYVAICIIIFTMILGMPYRFYWSVLNAAIIWIEYCLAVLIFDKEIDMWVFISNNYFVFATIFVGLTFLAVISKLTKKEFVARKMLAKEKQISEDLLLNILPKSIAVELEENGYVKPTYYPEATVMFIDFVGFTEISKKLTVEELIELLDFYFTNYDRIIHKYKLEKLKTVGDCYMCAGGLPVKNSSHPKESISAALDIISFMSETRDEKPFCPVRIGINTGELIAGVIGSKKFAYDIWGDTVNLAARLESKSQADKINISKRTYEYIKNDFECEYRGEIFVKGGGNIDMYYVTKAMS